MIRASLRLFTVSIASAFMITAPLARAEPAQLLNVSYDPTRELYAQINPLFAEQWKQQTGQDVRIDQSHGGSGKQARAVIDGLEADVVTLALANDIDEIAARGKSISGDWQTRLPDNSSPYTSTIVFLVRKGNPKAISDWNDLVKPGVSLVTPNPKTGGAPRWTYLAAWGSVLRSELGEQWIQNLKTHADAPEVAAAQAKARAFVSALYRNVAVLDSGARGSLTTFAQRGVGDVLLTWENEAHLALKEFATEGFEIVYPKISIQAEPPVAVVDSVVDKKGTRAVAEAYLKFLYTDEAQKVIAANWYRPRSKAALEQSPGRFPALELFSIEDVFGGWKKAQATHFAEGGVYDQIGQRQ